MSVLIRGMEMPNHCGECGIEWCERWKRLIVAGMPSAKARPEDCPLVPVPPHGRLIDVDYVYKRLQKQAMSVWGDGNPRYQIVLEVMDAIRFAPTIIPASEEGE